VVASLRLCYFPFGFFAARTSMLPSLIAAGTGSRLLLQLFDCPFMPVFLLWRWLFVLRSTLPRWDMHISNPSFLSFVSQGHCASTLLDRETSWPRLRFPSLFRRRLTGFSFEVDVGGDGRDSGD